MTPRLPLALLAAAALASPASAATVRPGTFTGYGTALVGSARLSGTVTWADGSTSSCTARVTGVTGSVSCTGDVAFAASCAGASSQGAVTTVCADTARNLHVVVSAAVAPTRQAAGTVSYARA